jgi:Tfp pilus assembly protein PilF
LEKAVSLDSEDWQSRYELASILADGGDPVRARELLRTVLQLQPDFMPAREELALDVLRRGNVKDATDQAQAMLARNPSAPEGHRIMALAFWKDGEYEASLAECALALQGRAGATEVLALQALDLWQLDRKKEARQVLAEAARDRNMRSRLANTDSFCRMVVCDAKSIAVVNDFVRRNRWIASPDTP